MSARKSSHRTIFLIVSSGSPLALIASSLRSTSKKPFCPMTRSLHPPIPRAVIESDSWGVGERDFSRCPKILLVLDLILRRVAAHGNRTALATLEQQYVHLDCFDLLGF